MKDGQQYQLIVTDCLAEKMTGMLMYFTRPDLKQVNMRNLTEVFSYSVFCMRVSVAPTSADQNVA